MKRWIEIRSWLSSRPAVGVMCFFLGAGAMFGWDHFRHPSVNPLSRPVADRDEDFPLAQILNDDGFPSGTGDPFAQMRKMRERMLKSFNEPGPRGLFGFQSGDKSMVIHSGDEITTREDDKYVYYDIAADGLKPEKLRVKVEDRQVSISGEIEKKSDENNGAVLFRSDFHRSFPAPDEVDAGKMQIEQADGKLVVKFPKTKGA
jgi:HSP20 family molecular chaperone IbpA